MPRLSPHDHVYELCRNTWIPFIGTDRLHRRQIEILKAVRALPWTVYLDYEENPKKWDLDGTWIHKGATTWLVPRDHSSSDLLGGYLGPGGWSMYLSSYPLEGTKIPSFFDILPQELCEFTRSHSIPVLIQAHNDNSEWRIALEPAVVPMTNVA